MLTLCTAPEDALPRLREGLIPLLEQELGSRKVAVEIEIAQPQPLYTTGLAAFASGNLLGDARLTSWQFLVLRARQPFGIAEVAVEEEQGMQRLVYAGFGMGPHSRSVIETLGVAERLPEIVARDYELRILRVPTVYLYCVWLHGDEGGDLFLPCDPAPSPLIPNEVVQAEAITSALHDFAVQRLKTGTSDI
jgi:hypothetical protein